MKFRTKYQKVADSILALYPTRTLVWHNNRLFWQVRSGWLELVVGSSSSWFRASEETAAILSKKH